MKRIIYIALVVSVMVAGMAFSQGDSTGKVPPEKILTGSAKQDDQTAIQNDIYHEIIKSQERNANHALYVLYAIGFIFLLATGLTVGNQLTNYKRSIKKAVDKRIEELQTENYEKIEKIISDKFQNKSQLYEKKFKNLSAQGMINYGSTAYLADIYGVALSCEVSAFYILWGIGEHERCKKIIGRINTCVELCSKKYVIENIERESVENMIELLEECDPNFKNLEELINQLKEWLDYNLSEDPQGNKK